MQNIQDESFKPTESLEWRKQHSPQLQPQPSRQMKTRIFLIGNRMRPLKIRRDKNDNAIVAPLSIHKVFIHTCNSTCNNVKEAWSSRVQFLNCRAPSVTIVEDWSAHRSCEVGF